MDPSWRNAVLIDRFVFLSVFFCKYSSFYGINCLISSTCSFNKCVELEILEVWEQSCLTQDLYYFSFKILLIKEQYLTSPMRKNFNFMQGGQGLSFGSLLYGYKFGDDSEAGRRDAF